MLNYIISCFISKNPNEFGSKFLYDYYIYRLFFFFFIFLFLFVLVYFIISDDSNKNLLKLFFSVELLTLILSLMLLISAHFHGSIYGQVFFLFVLSISALEAAVGLALLYLYFRTWRTTRLIEINKLK
jgi:NADH-quinone oxidoreductase subunit K